MVWMRYCSNPFVVPLQVLSILQEVFPAVEAAEMALKLRPLWWEGWQTLGRAQLNLGEVDLVSGRTLQKKNNPRQWGSKRNLKWKEVFKFKTC